MRSAVQYSPLEIACMVAGYVIFALAMALIESDAALWEEEHQPRGDHDDNP